MNTHQEETREVLMNYLLEGTRVDSVSNLLVETGEGLMSSQ